LESREILSDICVSVTELKKNPMAAVRSGEGFPIVVLNHNRPVFYCIPPEAYELLMDKLEDIEFNKIADSRKDQDIIKISIDEL